MATATAAAASVAAATRFTTEPKGLPMPDSDLYQLVDVLTADEKAIVKKVRGYQPSHNNCHQTRA
jgi:glutaryl-CoA dehydrogenase